MPSPFDTGATVLLRARLIHRALAPAASAASRASRADALLIRDGAILDVGPAAALRDLAGETVSVVDVGDAVIIPGLIDAHCHLGQLGVLASAADLRPGTVRDIEGLSAALASSSADPSGWVTGHGYTEYGLADDRSPTRLDLDRAVGDQPAVAFHASLHACVVSSAGLRRLGFHDDTPDPPGGLLGRDEAGRLDGRLVERPMFDLFAAIIARRLELDGAGLVGAATAALAGEGITSCVDANTTASEWRALCRAGEIDGLRVRVASLLRYEDAAGLLREPRPAIQPDRLRILGAKVFADGGMSSRTAAVEPPYATPAGVDGMLLLDRAALETRIRTAASLGVGIGVHAQGERAIGATLLAFEAAGSDAPDFRRLEHAGAFPAPLRDRAARAGLRVATQPAFLSALGDGFLEAFGHDRAGYLYPIRSMLESGIRVSGASDAPVVTHSPWVGMRDAVLRKTDRGEGLAPGEAIDLQRALGLYAADRAGVPWDHGGLGRLDPGAPADLAVVDRDPFTASAAMLPAVRVIATVVDGRLTHGTLPPPR